MGLLETNSYFQQSAKLVLASVGALLISSSSVFLPSVAQSVPQSSPRGFSISCGNNFFAQAFTQNYNVQICNNGNEKYSMILQSGSTGRSIAAHFVDDSKNVFVAKVGDTIAYTLDMNKREFTIVQKIAVRPIKGKAGINYKTVTTVEKITGLLQS
ncbi:MAG: hypothetical protein ICV85_04660 [Tolypothrix sp. T3-bin4]|nr:hypothetical protein [Tolypothrix sp. Co-bin9]MBD0301481.1 hypothetical protein [Tolypothrix sp. T3-bin4]